MAYTEVSTKILCLDRFAEIMGLNPVAFNQAQMGNVCYARCCNGCPETWYQAAWQTQGGFLSRDELAFSIASAERTIENYLGVSLCPELQTAVFPFKGSCVSPLFSYTTGWLASPLSHQLPLSRHRLPSYDLGDHPIWILPRTTSALLCETCQGDGITILDQNGDVYDNDGSHCPLLARIVCEIEDVEILACEVRVQLPGSNYPLCRPKSVEVVFDEEAGISIVTVEIEVWKLIKPELFTGPRVLDPLVCDNTSGQPWVIDLLDPDSLVECVELWREVEDLSLPTAEFCREPSGRCGCGSATCDICTPVCLPGCAFANTRLPGFVVAQPATWDGTKWCLSDPSCLDCAPGYDFVRIYYYTGYAPRGMAINSVWDMDCSLLERLVAQLAASRLVKPMCACSCEGARWWEALSVDTAYSKRDSGSFLRTLDILNNKIGTKVGEVEVWRELELIKKELMGGIMTSTAI